MTGPTDGARTVRLDHDVDPLGVLDHPTGTVFWRDRAGLCGWGEAGRLTVDDLDSAGRQVEEWLRGFGGERELDRPGCGPVAFVSIPFRRDRAATFVVPAVVRGRSTDGLTWETRIGDATDEPASPADPPSTFRVAPDRPPADWCAMVAEATGAIAGGAFEKVVLARSVTVEADAPLARRLVAERLAQRFAGCFLYAVGPFVGASPELLVRRDGDVVRAHPMAGTAPRGGDPTEDARLASGLLASSGYRHEHQITIDMVRSTLLPFSSYVDFEPEPSVVAVANVQHLASLVEGRLSSPAASVLDLVRALHPTPAVAGWPIEPALGWIDRHEGFDRGPYAGAVGWVDGDGNGAFAVAIRGALLDDRRATLWAGNGIVAGADPVVELAETRAKLQAMLGAIVQP